MNPSPIREENSRSPLPPSRSLPHHLTAYGFGVALGFGAMLVGWVRPIMRLVAALWLKCHQQLFPTDRPAPAGTLTQGGDC